MHVLTPKKDRNAPIILKGTLGRIGHQPHRAGVGAHADKRLRRCRTRAAQRQAAMRD